MLQLALKEHDEKQLYIARQNLHDLRSIYAVITDMLHKNIEKVYFRIRIAYNVTKVYYIRSVHRKVTTLALCTSLMTVHAQSFGHPVGRTVLHALLTRLHAHCGVHYTHISPRISP